MKKKSATKCFGAFITTLMLTTLPSTIVGAHPNSAPKQQNPITSESINEAHQINELIFLKVIELLEQKVGLEQIQFELQNMLKNIQIDIRMNKQTSMLLRGFYGNNLFACRGFA